MRQLRKLHHYLGVFLAPAILFFAVSGALQTFHLHEAKGWGGPPPEWFAAMGNIHKDQALSKEEESDRPRARPAKPERDEAKQGEHADGDEALPLKIFVLIMSIGLLLSTLLGIVIALNNPTMRRISLILLIAGTALPVLLLVI